MKKDLELSKQLKKIIIKEAESNPDVDMISEGFFNKVVNHIKKVLDRANNKSFAANLDQLAKSGPQGRKTAQQLVDTIERLEKEFQAIQNRRYGN
tara:strand:- start:50742 stop:51026 length:285 start_codon:yes stop_codon:yes gene_type:complete